MKMVEVLKKYLQSLTPALISEIFSISVKILCNDKYIFFIKVIAKVKVADYEEELIDYLIIDASNEHYFAISLYADKPLEEYFDQEEIDELCSWLLDHSTS